MEILRKNKGLSSYYEIRVGASGNGSSYAEAMLCNNSFSSLAPLSLQWVDGERLLLYKADGLVSIARRWGTLGPDWAGVRELLFELADCIRELQEYLLSPEGIVLSLPYLLYDGTEGKLRFLYVPDSGWFFADSMKELFEEIMPILQHGEDPDTMLFYDVYSHFLDGSITPELFLQMTDEWRSKEQRSSDTRTVPNRAEIIRKTAEMNSPVRPYGLPAPSSPGAAEGAASEASSFPGVAAGVGQRKEKRDHRRDIILYLAGAGILAVAVLLYLLFGSGSIRISALLGGAFVMFLICRIVLEDGKAGKEKAAGESVYDAAGADFSGSFGAIGPSGATPAVSPAGVSGTMEPQGGFGIAGSPGTSGISGPPAVIPSATSILRGSIRQLVPADRSMRAPLYVSEGYCRIGRSETENEYCIPAPAISRNHARLECCGNIVTLQDLGSTNGTFINHVRLAAAAAEELHYGDVVSFAGEEYYVV